MLWITNLKHKKGKKREITGSDIVKLKCYGLQTWRPPRAYKCLCIKRRIVGTLFPLESNDSCIDCVETPKTFALQRKKKITQLNSMKMRIKADAEKA